jgi:hypothetical protein
MMAGLLMAAATHYRWGRTLLSITLPVERSGVAAAEVTTVLTIQG